MGLVGQVFPGLTGRAGELDVVSGPPTIYAGWGLGGKIALSCSGTISDGIQSIQYEGKLQYRTAGFWLGAALPMALTESLGIRAEGWYFFPSVHTLNLESIFVLPPVSGRVSGDLDIWPNWWAVDLAIYRRMLPGFTLMAGGRHDSVYGVVGPGALGPVLGPDIPELQMQLNSFSPYVGFSETIGSGSQMLRITAKGFPTVVVTDPRAGAHGYFVELMAEYRYTSSPDTLIGIFVKADVMRASFTKKDSVPDVLKVFNRGLGFFIPAGSSLDAGTSAQWEDVVLGASASFKFSSDLLGL